MEGLVGVVVELRLGVSVCVGVEAALCEMRRRHCGQMNGRLNGGGCDGRIERMLVKVVLAVRVILSCHGEPLRVTTVRPWLVQPGVELPHVEEPAYSE